MKKYRKCGFKKYAQGQRKYIRFLGMLCVMLGVLLWTSPELSVYASATPTPVPTGAPDWLSFEPIRIIRTLASLFLAYISAKGAIQLGNNISEFAKAYKQNDDAGKQSALDGIFAGGLQFFIGGLLAILGITL